MLRRIAKPAAYRAEDHFPSEGQLVAAVEAKPPSSTEPESDCSDCTLIQGPRITKPRRQHGRNNGMARRRRDRDAVPYGRCGTSRAKLGDSLLHRKAKCTVRP